MSTNRSPIRSRAADVMSDNFADIHLLKNRTFQATPSIAVTEKGRIWAVWISGGPLEPHIDNYGIVSYSDDGGRSWIDPYLIIDHPVSTLVRINYITVWTDEKKRLWIGWTQTAELWEMKENEDMTGFAICFEDPDAQKPLYSEPMYMFPTHLHNKPTRLSTGEWIYATEHIGKRDTSFIYAAKASGETPVLRGTVLSRSPSKCFHEARITERKDGSLWILSRIERGQEGGMEEAFSLDDGRTWSDFKSELPAPLRGPGSRFHIRRLKSGALLLINHDNERQRSRLSAYLSDDDGSTWTAPFLLDGRENISYPDACEAADGRIFITYDRNRTTDAEILMVSVTEEEIRRGTGAVPGILTISKHMD